jgi:hypothetical protein
LETVEADDPARVDAGCWGGEDQHVYHGACLARWANQGKTTCPVCKCQLSPRVSITAASPFGRPHHNTAMSSEQY